MSPLREVRAHRPMVAADVAAWSKLAPRQHGLGLVIRRVVFVLTATLSALAAMLLSPPRLFPERLEVVRTTPVPSHARISWPIAYGRKAAFL